MLSPLCDTQSLPLERSGTVANVVFPTGIDRRDDLGSPDRFDVYYGMADHPHRRGTSRTHPGLISPSDVALSRVQASALDPATTSNNSSSMELCRSRFSDRRNSSETLSMFFSARCIASSRLAFSLASDSAQDL